MADDDLNQELVNLGFLLDVAAASPQAFDLETVLGKARRAIAALQAVLELMGGPVGLEGRGLPGDGLAVRRAVREVIRRELPYGSPHE
jgi:hypothetical protein